MHDLYAAKEILRKILTGAKKNKLKKISRVILELGSLIDHSEEINAENLKFNLKMLAKGTALEGAVLEIKKIKGDFWRLKEIVGE